MPPPLYIEAQAAASKASVALRVIPRRDERIMPAELTRMASSHSGQSVGATTTGSEEYASDWLVSESVMRHHRTLVLLAEPNEAPRVKDCGNDTGDVDAGSQTDDRNAALSTERKSEEDTEGLATGAGAATVQVATARAS